jgi:hypothetical protein
VNAKSEAAEQVRNEARTRSLAPGSYVLYDSRSKIADVYRSGEYNGSKYMTSDDFVRYFKSRRAFYSPSLEKEKLPEEAELRGAAAQKRGKGASRAGLVSGESGGKEGHLQTAISALKLFREKWFPVERKEGRVNVGGYRMPVAAMSGIAVFAVSLGLIVGGTVMLGNASGEVSSLNSTISVLEAKQGELQEKLDVKYNIDEIEAEAKRLGMVKRQTVDNKYIESNRGEQIIVYEDGEGEKIGLASLLAAFGIELD